MFDRSDITFMLTDSTTLNIGSMAISRSNDFFHCFVHYFQQKKSVREESVYAPATSWLKQQLAQK
jgi:allantoicase